MAFGKKRCSRCLKWKNRAREFYRDRTRYDSSQAYCIECKKAVTNPISLSWYYANREKEKERMKAFYQKRKQERKERKESADTISNRQ
jgi:hypothetical protein